MADIFDTLEAAPKGDVFDQVAPKGDVFDQVSSPQAASAPESVSADAGWESGKVVPPGENPLSGLTVVLDPKTKMLDERDARRASFDATKPLFPALTIPHMDAGTASKWAGAVDPTGIWKLLPTNAAGIGANVAIDTANFFQSPVGLSTMGIGLLPKLAQSAVAAAFAASALHEAPESIKAIHDAATPEERDQAITAAVENALVLGGTGAHIIGLARAASATLNPEATQTARQLAASDSPLTAEQVIENAATTTTHETPIRPTSTVPGNSTAGSGLPEGLRPATGREASPTGSAGLGAGDERSPAAQSEAARISEADVAPALDAPKKAAEHSHPDLQTEEIPLDQLTLSKDVPQFKQGADEKGVITPLSGKFTREGVAPIAVWERLDGTREVISGRHRFDLAQRSGEKSIPAQIYREADGVTPAIAATIDAELNIRDDKGSAADYAQHFKNSGIDEATARERGLLGNAKSKAGWAIARGGSEDLLALHRAGEITDAQAQAIAEAAPGQPDAQRIGTRAALDGRPASYIGNLLKAFAARSKSESAKQLDLLGNDDAAMLEMDAQAKVASKAQKEISDSVRAIEGAGKNPALAAKEGVDVKDPQGVQKRVAELKAEKERWDNWPMHPDLVAKTRGDKYATPPIKGDLFTEDLSLVGEQGVDTIKAAEEKAAADKASAEAKAKQDREQQDMFAPKPPDVLTEDVKPPADNARFQKVVDAEISGLHEAADPVEALDHMEAIEDDAVRAAIAKQYGIETQGKDANTLNTEIAEKAMEVKEAGNPAPEAPAGETTSEEEGQPYVDPSRERLPGGGTMKRRMDVEGAVDPSGFVEAAKAVAKLPGAKAYADGWRHRVSSFFKQVGAIKRFIESRVQRDIIPALYDAAETEAGKISDQARSHVKLGTQPMEREAATFIQQSNGDKVGMIAKLEAIRGKGYDTLIDFTIRNWDRLQAIAERAKAMTDEAFDAAKASGIVLEYREGYAKGAYEEYDPHNRKVVFDAQKGGGGNSTAFTEPKVFDDYAEAIAAGFKPKTLDLADLTQSAVLATMKKVNRRAWASALSEIKMPDGKPVVTSAERITSERPVESVDESGTVGGGVEIRSHGLKAPDGYRLMEIEPGSLVAVHEEAFPLLSKLTDSSHFPMVLAKTAGAIKHNILAFDIYHGSRFGQMQMAFQRQVTPSFRKGLATLEYADRDLATAVNSGEITTEQAAYARDNRPILDGGIASGLNVGRISDALFKDIAPLFPGAKATTNFIFQKLSRGIIAESYVYAFKRNAGLHPEMTDAALHRFTAKEVNTYYRNLGNQGLFKSKTWQDTARFLAFAPQWFEGRVTSEASGYGQIAKTPFNNGKLGNVGAGMATGLVGYFALAQVVNMLTRGTPTWENPESGHKLDAWIPDPIGGSTGQFISPMSVFAETAHDVVKLHDRGQSALDIPGDIAKGTVGPVPRTAWDLLSGHDFYGQKLEGFDRFTQAAKDIAPVPLSLKSQGRAGSGERQGLSFAGIKAVGAGSASFNTYKLADDWMRGHSIKRPGAQEGEHGPASVYQPLKSALDMNDMAKARRELTTLRKTVKDELIDRHFSSLDSVRFTGRKSTEDDFIASLKPRQKAIYDRALIERRKAMDRYDSIR